MRATSELGIRAPLIAPPPHAAVLPLSNVKLLTMPWHRLACSLRRGAITFSPTPNSCWTMSGRRWTIRSRSTTQLWRIPQLAEAVPGRSSAAHLLVRTLKGHDSLPSDTPGSSQEERGHRALMDPSPRRFSSARPRPSDRAVTVPSTVWPDRLIRQHDDRLQPRCVPAERTARPRTVAPRASLPFSFQVRSASLLLGTASTHRQGIPTCSPRSSSSVALRPSPQPNTKVVSPVPSPPSSPTDLELALLVQSRSKTIAATPSPPLSLPASICLQARPALGILVLSLEASAPTQANPSLCRMASVTSPSCRRVAETDKKNSGTVASLFKPIRAPPAPEIATAPTAKVRSLLTLQTLAPVQGSRQDAP